MTLKTLRLSKSDGVLSYLDQGAGAPLVLIHGVGLQSAAWGPQSAALQESCRVIALDMPGHGGSDPLPVGSQLPDYVAWCREAVAALGLGPVNLAGHSMGALIVGGFAVQFPEMVRRVALLNGVFRRDAAARNAVEARAAQIGKGSIEMSAPLTRWFGDTPVDLAAKEQVAAWLGAVDPAGYATAYTAFAHGDATYADQLCRIECPFLTLTADGDLNSTPAMSEAMANLAQNGTAITLKGHRHMANLTAAGEVNAHLLTWLRQPSLQKVLQ